MNTNEKMLQLLKAVKALGDLAREINPEINHVHGYSIGAGADFTAWVEGEEDREPVFTIHMFEDGSYKIGDVYYYADGSIDFRSTPNADGGVSA